MVGQLGPVVAVDGRCTVGDVTGTHIVLLREGVAQIKNAVEASRVPWARFMDINLQAQPGKTSNSRGFSRVTRMMLNLGGIPYVGNGTACLAGTLRTPYEYWSADFDHHPCRYERREIIIASEFLGQLVEKKHTAHLGDFAWVSGLLTRLQLESEARGRSAKDLVQNVLESAT